MKNSDKTVFSVLMLTYIIFGIFGGFIFYWFGYLSGLFISLFVGNKIVEGLGILGITITTHQIPMICGTLNVLGSFFGKINSSSSASK